MKELLQTKTKELQDTEKKILELDKAFTDLKNDYVTKRDTLFVAFHQLTGSVNTIKELLNGERKEGGKQV